MKTAVILFNLGGPDSKEAIRPFLFNFFMDKNILRMNIFFRFLLASWISITRSRKKAAQSYAHLGYKSPLLENTKVQAVALEKNLNEEKANAFRVFTCMRYWHPMAQEVVRQVQKWRPNKIVLLPLYPQYSTTTTKSSFESWEKACLHSDLNFPTQKIDDYHTDEGFISASAENIENIYRETGQSPRLLFSAHGLPESITKEGDPYQKQCEESAKAIVQKLEIEDLDWQICYQSRVGPKKWIGPSTREALKKAATDKVPVLIYPLSFTQEHVETLVELDIEYKNLAQKLGIPAFYRVPTVGTHPDFIKGLAELVVTAPM